MSSHIWGSFSCVPNRERTPRRHRNANQQDRTIPFIALPLDGDLRADGSDDTDEEREERAQDAHHRAELGDGDRDCNGHYSHENSLDEGAESFQVGLTLDLAV